MPWNKYVDKINLKSMEMYKVSRIVGALHSNGKLSYFTNHMQRHCQSPLIVCSVTGSRKYVTDSSRFHDDRLANKQGCKLWFRLQIQIIRKIMSEKDVSERKIKQVKKKMESYQVSKGNKDQSPLGLTFQLNTRFLLRQKTINDYDMNEILYLYLISQLDEIFVNKDT